MSTLSHLLKAPQRPLVAVLGGAKVSDTIAVVDRFRELVDTILIGGAMCFPSSPRRDRRWSFRATW